MNDVKHNGGFTLLELVIATAIMGLISLTVAGFMSTGARTYSAIHYNLRLQYISQLALGQIEHHTLNCNQSIAWDASTQTLTLVEIQTDGQTLTRVFVQKADALYYGEQVGTAPDTIEATALVAEYVADFSANILPVVGEKEAVTLTLKLKHRGKEHTMSRTVALRNHPNTPVQEEGATT